MAHPVIRPAKPEDLDALQNRMERIVMKVPVAQLESPLNGREIMELLSIPPGPKIEEVKNHLCNEVIEGRLPPGDKESARLMAKDKFGA